MTVHRRGAVRSRPCLSVCLLWSVVSDALCSLETLLKDIVCIQYFRNYLMSINRVEYILAWVEMEVGSQRAATRDTGAGRR